MKIYERSLQALLSSAPRSRGLARLTSLAQIGELAHRLMRALFGISNIFPTVSFLLFKKDVKTSVVVFCKNDAQDLELDCMLLVKHYPSFLLVLLKNRLRSKGPAASSSASLVQS